MARGRRCWRRRRLMRTTSAAMLLALTVALAAAQQDGGGGGLRPPPPGGGGGGSGSGGANLHPLVRDLQAYVNEGDGMLLIMGNAADSPPPPPPPGGSAGPPPLACDGLPALVTRSAVSNGACFGPNVTTSLSCSCITDLARLDEWKIRVTAPSRQSDAPATLPSSAVLGINSILVFTLPSTLVSFSLIAESTQPLPLKIQLMPGPGSQGVATPWLVRVPFTNVFKTLEIANIDLGGLQLKSGFLPTAVQNLSLRKCKLARLQDSFLNEFSELRTLDVSMNKLSGVYEDVAEASPARSPLTSLNLSGNALTELPIPLLSFKRLKQLDLTGNPIANFSVDNATADALAALTVFKLSPPAATATCEAGTWRRIQDASVCVPLAPVAGQVAAPEVKEATHSYLIYVVIAGSIVIAVLIFLFIRKRFAWGRKTTTNKDALESLFDSTIPFDESQPTVNASLVNDPIIITNRIPYNDLRVANCISKGGFGLVYSGVYNRRRVAIKKIRPDRAGDIKMIEAFLKEICMMATLHHPHIVEFVGVSWDTLRNLCAVTEFMDRGDLREVLQAFKLRNTPLTWGSYKSSISLHIADALTYLHSLSPKVIHRDLKSKNVLLNSEMEAKLSDFGISRERHIEETHMTAGIGTSFWIAPEVLLGKDYDERADIFSFGVVLSEIDTDDYPYWNASNPNAGGEVQQNAILQMVASGVLRPSFSESCPPRVLELADRCLQVDPDDRPTAAEIVYELQRFISTLPPPSQRDRFSTSSTV